MAIQIVASQPDKWRQPAEYEPTKAVWMFYPQITHKKGFDNFSVQLNMMHAIIPSAIIHYIVRDESVKNEVLKKIPAKWVSDGNIIFHFHPYQEFWARDFGPVFLKNQKGKKAIADFMFNAWGYGSTSDPGVVIDEQVDEKIAQEYQLPLLSTNMISEGGNREISRLGLLLATQTVEMQRNPEWTLQQMEEQYQKLLGVNKVIWLKKGVRDDDMSTIPPIKGPGGKNYYTMLTTGGHIDEYARFANDSTVLLAWIPPKDRTNDIEKQTGERMEANYEILRSAVNINGRPLQIVKVPMPYVYITTLQPSDSVYKQIEGIQLAAGQEFISGEPIDCVAAASYLNFVIVNDRVLLSSYWEKGMSRKIRKRDTEVLKLLQKVFPDKKIMTINPIAVNFGGGGMHCISMNEPF
jgi:agmatine deiminase